VRGAEKRPHTPPPPPQTSNLKPQTSSSAREPHGSGRSREVQETKNTYVRGNGGRGQGGNGAPRQFFRGPWQREQDWTPRGGGGRGNVFTHPNSYFNSRGRGNFGGVRGYVVSDTPENTCETCGLGHRNPCTFEGHCWGCGEPRHQRVCPYLNEWNPENF
jgi:hypothetical protein